MARRPYFSGNYGSALGSYDTAAKLIAQAGATQGQMYANLGQQLGSAIGSSLEKFRLNKEKKEKEQRAENQFLNLYEGNPENPIFKNLGIQSTDEAKAVAKDISKDPQLIQQAMQFAQFATVQQQAQEASALNALQRRNVRQQMGDRRKTQQGNQQLANFNLNTPQGETPDQFRQRAIQAQGAGNMNPQAMIGASNQFLARRKEQAQLAKPTGRTTIVDPKTGKPMVTNLDAMGRPTSFVGEAPSLNRFRTPEDEVKLQVQGRRETDASNFINDTRKSALSFSKAMTAANRLTDLLDKGVETGGISQFKAGLSTFAQSLGVELPEEIKNQTAMTQAFTQASGEFLFNAISNTKGAISEKEMDIFERMSPGMKNSVEGNRLMLEFVKQVGAREKQKLQLIRSLEKKGVMPTEIADQVEQFMLDNDLSGILPQVEESEQQAPQAQQLMAPGPIRLKGGGTFTPAR